MGNRFKGTSFLFPVFLPGLFLFACATTPPMQKFVSFAETYPDRIWTKEPNAKLKHAIQDYREKKVLASGQIYGAVARNYSLLNKCAEEVQKEMIQQNCKEKTDVLKAPKTNQPLLNQKGQTIPLLVYLCEDGSVVRLKPEGDPTSKFKPQPLASKALRYPFDSKFENFDDEVVKVDNFGNAIPKWTKDMNPELTKPGEQADFIQGWADDAHTDLKLNCGSAT